MERLPDAQRGIKVVRQAQVRIERKALLKRLFGARKIFGLTSQILPLKVPTLTYRLPYSTNFTLKAGL